LVEKTKEIGVGKIATVAGRYYAMDRDNNWDRVEKAYAALVYGEGAESCCAVKAIEDSYANGVTDEFVVPAVCDKEGTVKPNDSIVFFNFRPDRAREITRTFVDPDFKGFERRNGFFPVKYVCFTQYDATMPNVSVAFKPQSLKNTLGEYASSLGLTQLRIAETEKYAHVTFFFNGGVEKQYEGEDRILVNSPKVATYDLQPEMSAYEVADKCVAAIESGKYDMIILNFANCDMVGHTGVFEAAVKAVEAVDECVGKVTDAVAKMGGVSLITADHGNADRMYDDDGSPFTAHTTNPVPFCVVGYPCTLREGGRLADIAPTMLRIMGIAQPAEMDGKSMIE
ncbi:MAG: 2,3-bisphosphoglycerate-independent phosphoglycerate mutase, partial [Clostridia bacterium]|nr:2,3-bisphosphoglycerate-independent phosphoglycerate mutase [Clostridia bacterium]